MVAVLFSIQVFKPWAALLNPEQMSYQKDMFRRALNENRDEAKPVGYTAMEALCVSGMLDDLGIPDGDGHGEFSLWGRVQKYAELCASRGTVPSPKNLTHAG